MRCRTCELELWMIDGPGYGVRFCRFCDTVFLRTGVYAGPPSLSFTDPNGLFPMQLLEGEKK